MFYTRSEKAKLRLFGTTGNYISIYSMDQYSLSYRISRRVLRSIEPLRKWVPGVKPYMIEVSQPPPCSAEIKNTWCYNSTVQYTFSEKNVKLSALVRYAKMVLRFGNEL